MTPLTILHCIGLALNKPANKDNDVCIFLSRKGFVSKMNSYDCSCELSAAIFARSAATFAVIDLYSV